VLLTRVADNAPETPSSKRRAETLNNHSMLDKGHRSTTKENVSPGSTLKKHAK